MQNVCPQRDYSLSFPTVGIVLACSLASDDPHSPPSTARRTGIPVALRPFSAVTPSDLYKYNTRIILDVKGMAVSTACGECKVKTSGECVYTVLHHILYMYDRG